MTRLANSNWKRGSNWPGCSNRLIANCRATLPFSSSRIRLTPTACRDVVTPFFFFFTSKGIDALQTGSNALVLVLQFSCDPSIACIPGKWIECNRQSINAIESKREHSILLIIIGNLSRIDSLTHFDQKISSRLSKIFFLSAYARMMAHDNWLSVRR